MNAIRQIADGLRLQIPPSEFDIRIILRGVVITDLYVRPENCLVPVLMLKWEEYEIPLSQGH